MKQYMIKISEQAERDLRGIFEYIAVQLQSAQNAAGQLSRIYSGIKSLECFPQRYKVYEKQPWNDRGTRIMPIDHFNVIYIPDDERELVNIIRVLYRACNMDEALL